MIDLRDKETGKVTRRYECTPRECLELCFANIECLLHIALADSDEHIRQLGGEQELLNLMNGYLDLAQRLKDWNKGKGVPENKRYIGAHDMKLADDGTACIEVDMSVYSKVGRILLECGNYGTLYYPDKEDE